MVETRIIKMKKNLLIVLFGAVCFFGGVLFTLYNQVPEIKNGTTVDINFMGLKNSYYCEVVE